MMRRRGVSALFVVLATIVLVLIAGTILHAVFSGGIASVLADIMGTSEQTQQDASEARSGIISFIEERLRNSGVFGSGNNNGGGEGNGGFGNGNNSQGSGAPGVIGGGESYDNKVCDAPSDATTVSTRSELKDALSSASSGDTVYVNGDAEIDMGEDRVTVPSGVTLASDRGCDGATGGTIMLPADHSQHWAMIYVESDARITGLHLQGPHEEYFEGSDPISVGIKVDGSNVEIDNNEIAGFSHAGVLARGGGEHIHHNHIHHNPMSGLGYGVNVGSQDVVIEYNYFNYNRHSVANSGSGGYEVRYNHFGPEAISYAIGTHRPGGTTLLIHHNTVEAVDHMAREGDEPSQGPVVTIRGVPEDVAEIHHNWFYHPDPPDEDETENWSGPSIQRAIAQPVDADRNELTSWQSVEFHDNHYGEEEPDSCDIGAPREGC